MRRRDWVLALGSIVMIMMIFVGSSYGERQEAEAAIMIRIANTEISLNLDQIRAIGEQSFTATLRSSSSPASEHVYVGIPLKDLVSAVGLALEEKHQVFVKAEDGYAVALMGNEVLKEDHVFLAYFMDGEPLSPRELGGSGPYQLIIPNDAFSMRWCKYVVEVEIR